MFHIGPLKTVNWLCNSKYFNSAKVLKEQLSGVRCVIVYDCTPIEYWQHVVRFETADKSVFSPLTLEESTLCQEYNSNTTKIISNLISTHKWSKTTQCLVKEFLN